MVQVQSTWFPLIDRNPQKFVDNIFKATDPDFVNAIQRIFRSKGPRVSSSRRPMSVARLLGATGMLLCLSALQALPQDTTPPMKPREDTRAQYPPFLADSYFSVNLGYIDYAFSDRQLAPGFHAGS